MEALMARIRTIKPEWLEDELISRASPEARVMSVALILLADDYGNGRAAQPELSFRVFPPRDNSPEALQRVSRIGQEALLELLGLGFVQLYQVRGQHYYRLPGWDKHQKVNHPGKPQVPAPPESLKKSSRDFSRDSLENSQESLLPDQDQEGRGRARAPAHAREDRGTPPDPHSRALGTEHTEGGVEESQAARPKPRDRFGENFMADPPLEIPQDDEVTRGLAARAGGELEELWAQCRDYYLGRGERSADWPAMLRAWLRREPRFVKPTKPKEEAKTQEDPLWD
jgi:hypothetical protein